MPDAHPFTKLRARITWRLYFFRAEVALASLSPLARRELLSDLASHLSDILDNDGGGEDENVRVRAALARVGDPAEFLSPLIAESVFKAPSRHPKTNATIRALAFYAVRTGRFVLGATVVSFTGVLGTALMLASLASLAWPGRFGIFLVGESSIRIGGRSDLAPGIGAQLLTPWSAVPLAVLGACMIAWALLRTRAALVRLLGSVGVM